MYLNRSPNELTWAYHRSSPPEQTITISPRGKALIAKLLPMTSFISYNHPWKVSVEVIPLASLADQTIVPTTSPRQRQEIALKQVSHSIFKTF